jgi:hypothetical protein
MKNIFEHIEHVKGKPHHIRKQVAFGAATVGASFIGLMWVGVSLATNSFAIQGSSFAQSTGQATVETVQKNGQQNLAGAAAALSPEEAAKPRIEIVNIATSSGPVSEPEQTTIPF